MPKISETAYPRLNANPSRKELQQIFTPTPEEAEFSWNRTSSEIQTLRLLTWLKVFQRLGYFPSPDEVSARIIDHIADVIGVEKWSDALASYEGSSLKWVHHSLVRDYLQVTAFGDNARKAAHEACLEASTTRDDLVDIVNVAIEELIRQRHELPAYSTLVRIARTARQRINTDYHLLVVQRLSEGTKDGLRKLFEGSGRKHKTAWDSVKKEPSNPTVRHMQEFLNHLDTLLQHDLRLEAFAGIPAVKVTQFAAEARAVDVASMRDFAESKRLTLAASLVLAQVGRAYDDVADMFIRLVQRLHSRAREALTQHRLDKAAETDKLIATLHDVSVAFKNSAFGADRLTAIEAVIGSDLDLIIDRCEKHALLAGNNHLPLLLKFYKGQRAPLLNFLSNVSLISTSQDCTLVAAIEFVVKHRSSRTEWLPSSSLDLSFASDKWMLLITGNKSPNAPFDKVHRRYLELCVFTQVMNELKSGDLYIPLSDRFRDYREQLISWVEYQREIELYGRQSGMETDPKTFVATLKTKFEKSAAEADQGFPANEYLSLEDGEPVLKRLTARLTPVGQDAFEAAVKGFMQENDVLNILWETETWLNWTKHFGPISGLDAKIVSSDVNPQ